MLEVLPHLRTIAKPDAAKSGDLAKAIRTLDEILASRGKELPGRLRHFLENRSYQKALVFLEGGEPEKGTCGN
tara:strand:- start:177 stop:395 length:219 start_codon:yes stop_codon:yes gene_type:complete